MSTDNSQQIIQAVVFQYETLNKYPDVAEDIETKKKHVEDLLKSKLILTALDDPNIAKEDLPWEFSMNPKAAECMAFMKSENIKAGLLLPQYPIQSDVDRFLEMYGSDFEHAMPTEETKQLKDSAEPLERLCAEFGLECHRVMFVVQQEHLIVAAKQVLDACEKRKKTRTHTLNLHTQS